MDLSKLSDLGNFSDDRDKYIDVFQGLTQAFNLSWKGVTLLLDKTLTGSEKQTVFRSCPAVWRQILRLILVGLTVKGGVNTSPLGDKLSLWSIQIPLRVNSF